MVRQRTLTPLFHWFESNQGSQNIKKPQNGVFFKNGDLVNIWFVTSWSPWFDRGNHYSYGASAGVFEFSNTQGDTWTTVSFRVYSIL